MHSDVNNVSFRRNINCKKKNNNNNHLSYWPWIIIHAVKAIDKTLKHGRKILLKNFN